MSEFGKYIRLIEGAMNESPMLIPNNDFEPSINDFDVNDDKENGQLYEKLTNSSRSKHLEHYDNNFEIIQYGDKYILLNHAISKVDYYVKVEQGSYQMLGKWLSQVEVWRKYESPLSHMVPYMFKKYILPRYGMVISDSMQTDMGRVMWTRLIYKMIEEGKYTYIYDKNRNVLIPLPDYATFQDNLEYVYGNTKKFKNIRLVVSDRMLK